MNERSKYEKEVLISEIEAISISLVDEVELFLIGGLAMINYGLKAVTKDIDIVFLEDQMAEKYKKTLIANGFIRSDPDSIVYRRLGAFSMFERPGGYRFDIFVNSVCGKMMLSKGMVKRSRRYPLPGKIILNIISPEDIFLFKSITGRDDDLEDMKAIARSGINWDIIENEMSSQPGSWRWAVMFYQSLLDLEEEHSIRSPLMDKFREKAEISMGIEIAYTSLERQPIPYSDLIEVIDQDENFSKRVIERMRELDLIEEKDGMIGMRDLP